MARHLITGVAGQDGVHLARLLLTRGDDVIGTLGPSAGTATSPLLDGVDLRPLDVRDTRGFAELVAQTRPDVVHNLAALSSVGRSWSEPDLTRAVNATAVEGMLDVLTSVPEPRPRFVQASSSEIFGAAGDVLLDETSPLRPVSPYGESKAAAHQAVQEARTAGLFAANVILFGHTSALHAPHFALPSVVRQAVEVATGRREILTLQDPEVRRDWGAASDVVRAWAAVAAHAEPLDVVVATGVTHTLGEVAQWALQAAGVEADVEQAGAPRRVDISGTRGDPTRARRTLGWHPRLDLRTLIEQMVQAARAEYDGVPGDLSALVCPPE